MTTVLIIVAVVLVVAFGWYVWRNEMRRSTVPNVLLTPGSINTNLAATTFRSLNPGAFGVNNTATEA